MIFDGEWSTTFGRLYVQESAGNLNGTYSHMGGRIEGKVDERTFCGTWIQPENSRRGRCELVVDEQSCAFSGRWCYEDDEDWRGSWDGVRIDAPPVAKGGFPGGRGSYGEGPLLSGPMLGEVSETTARIWAQARTTSKLVLTVYTENGIAVRQVETNPDSSEWLCTVFRVDELSANTTYTYTIESDAGSVGPFPLKLAKPRNTRQTKIAFGSCFLQYNAPGPVLEQIGCEDADTFIMLGDTTYFAEKDWQTEHTMMRAHLRSRNNAEFRQLVTSVPTLGVWDDHDFGPNNTDGHFANRDASLSAFSRCWAQSRFERLDPPGIHSSVRVGAAEIFLLDSRSFKYTDQHSLLGQTQIQWLIGALLESDAPVKLIASPSQVLPEFPVREQWDSFRTDAPKELEMILSAIEAHDIRGVVFLSGDLHMGNLIHVPARQVGKHLGPEFWELTSSPLANVPWNVAELGRDRYLVAEVIDQVNYGLVDIDLDRDDAEIVLQLKGPDGGTFFEQAISLRSLCVR